MREENVLHYPIMKRFRGIIIVAVLIGGCFTTEYVSIRRAVPTGRISNLRQYLAWRTSSEQFAAIDVKGKQHVIAYGPGTLLLSSGPSAYVFDDSGRLVDWSTDIGDAPKFDERWNAQRSCGGAQSLSRSEVKRIASTQPNE